ncbi:cold-shock protein [Nesterenkonia muleiensis]|uniref:cold-shock protein n=1 Tax=Nesterenkonia muleiensis TaxID=2282648 RepID=UPI000E750FB0|nr:cold shock domain-containing protein [Nesterenkonia muleiensis]
MPTGKVKWFDADKGFGFVAGDDGQEVYLHSSALPSSVDALKSGTRLEYGIADGRRGKQALSVRVINAAPSVARANRKPAEEMGELVQDLVTLLDNTTGQLRKGHYPKPEQSKKIAALMRRVAEDFDA